MEIECHNVTSDELKRYREISIGYRAETRFRIDRPDGGLKGLHLIDEKLTESMWIDYDALEDEGVFRWERWNLENWKTFYAVDSGSR